MEFTSKKGQTKILLEIANAIRVFTLQAEGATIEAEGPAAK